MNLIVALLLLTALPAPDPCDHLPLVKKYAPRYPYFVEGKRYTLHPALVLALITQESQGNPQATSPVGARGLMQLMPRTAELLDCKYEEMYDPDTNIRCGVKFLAALLTYTKGDLLRALSGYNGGSHSTEKSPLLGGRIADNPETKNYVKKVLTYYDRYKKNPCNKQP